jgi:selenocysteine lyase/cysteine desulfurase
VIGLAYLNYAGLAPLRLRSAAAAWLPWEIAGNALLPGLVERQQRIREMVADWLGVTDRNVAFLTSTTAALQAVAAAVPWQPGDVVVYPAGDFPANVLPWTGLAARRGVEAVAVEPDGWAAPFPTRTRLVAISTVDYTTGDERPWRDVCARARAAGAWTCVDAIQSAGILPSRTDDVDFWAAGTQKWLVSGLGLGLLVVGDRALAELAGPWETYLGRDDPRMPGSPPADSARRFELGWVTPGALVRFESSFRHLAGRGWDAVGAEIHEIRDRLHERLLDMGWPVVSSPARPSGIVSFDPAPRRASDVIHDGYRRRIVVADRAGLVRLSAHVFTGRREIERTLDWLWRIRAGRIVPAEAAAMTAARRVVGTGRRA